MAHGSVSWHRSQSDPGTEDGALDAAAFAALFEDIDVDEAHPDLSSENAAVWKCARCQSTQWVWSDHVWSCERCGCKEFYNPASPSRYETERCVDVYAQPFVPSDV